MSDFRAISGVSSTLQALLRDRMELPGGVTLNDLQITISTPLGETPPGTPPAPEAPRVNLFLYQVSESPFLSNQDLPGRGHPAAYGNPPLSLNLHYLVTAYGSHAAGNGAFLDESQAQQLLGSAMRVLHDFPLVGESLQTMREPVGRAILHPALVGAYERLKICLDPISIEDLTKIWTALTIPYRLSAAYSVSVVQIESRRARRYPQLVGERPNAGPMVTVIPLQTPAISSLTVRRQGDPPDSERPAPYARIGDTLIIHGLNFSGGATTVSLGDLELPVTPLSGQRIELALPDDTYTFAGTTTPIPTERRLQPGALNVDVKVSPVGLPQAGVRSNRAVFMLTPHVQSIVGAAPNTLTITGARLLAADLVGETLVGRLLFDASAYTAASPTSIQLTLPDALPRRGVNVFLSTPLAGFPLLASPPELEVTIGGGVAQTIQLANIPATFQDAASALQAAMRAAPVADLRYKEARVTTRNNRFILVAGGLQAAIVFNNTPTAAQLGLDALTARPGYLSGSLQPFPALSAPPGSVRVTMGGVSAIATLAAAPVSLLDAADKVHTAISAADPGPEFVNSLTTALGDQLLITSGGNTAVNVTGVTGGDETTVAELQLRGFYPVRVRVNGVEAIGGVNRIELPL
jgi:hypothetical protein